MHKDTSARLMFARGEYDHRPFSWRPVEPFIIIVGNYAVLGILYISQIRI